MCKVKEYTQEELEQHRELWCQALESGEYMQYRGGALKGIRMDGYGNEYTGYCCLGVLKEVALANGVEVTTEPQNRSSAYADPEFMAWVGLAANNGLYDTREGIVGSENTLTIDNDSRKDFKQIAQTIRSKPPRLFKS